MNLGSHLQKAEFIFAAFVTGREYKLAAQLEKKTVRPATLLRFYIRVNICIIKPVALLSKLSFQTNTTLNDNNPNNSKSRVITHSGFVCLFTEHVQVHTRKHDH